MKKTFINNVLNLILSNLLTLVIGFLSSMVTPLILGNTQFGYYKIFTLYINYVPLLHVGFIDGILIRNAGKKFERIPLKKFRTYTKFLLIFEFTLSLMMVIVTFFASANLYYTEILLAVAVYSFLLNINTYFQFFSKCIMRFDELAKITRIQSYINFTYLSLAYFLYKFSLLNLNVTYYLFFMNVTQLILVIWYLVRYKCLLFGDKKRIIEERKNIFVFFKLGFMIMISYQITMFMINADNQFISIFFKISEYAQYAFAYSLAIILTMVFSTVSSVMLPYMKKAGKKIVAEKYDINLSKTCILIFFIILAYYPIVWIVNIFLVSYTESVQYLKIVFPGVGITCLVQSYLFNNYILFKKIKVFCFISLLNLAFDYLVYYIFYLNLKNTFIIAFLSIPLLLIWYISLEIYMHKLLNVRISNNLCYIVVMSAAFILINHEFNYLLGMIMYLLFYIIFTVIIYNRSLKQIFIIKK